MTDEALLHLALRHIEAAQRALFELLGLLHRHTVQYNLIDAFVDPVRWTRKSSPGIVLDRAV
jgi:hypothetical protein